MNFSIITAISIAFISLNAYALKLSDYTPFEYEVFFTNPTCSKYHYDEPVEANDGSLLYNKPKNTYCKRGDYKRNAKRKSSPREIGDKI